MIETNNWFTTYFV